MFSKFIYSRTETSGFGETLANTAATYSPINPMKNICTDEKKNSPITNGAMPKGIEYQKINLIRKYVIAIIRLNPDKQNPANVAILIGIFELEVIPIIA